MRRPFRRSSRLSPKGSAPSHATWAAHRGFGEDRKLICADKTRLLDV